MGIPVSRMDPIDSPTGVLFFTSLRSASSKSETGRRKVWGRSGKWKRESWAQRVAGQESRRNRAGLHLRQIILGRRTGQIAWKTTFAEKENFTPQSAPLSDRPFNHPGNSSSTDLALTVGF
jgi:hypothetical protein